MCALVDDEHQRHFSDSSTPCPQQAKGMALRPLLRLLLRLESRKGVRMRLVRTFDAARFVTSFCFAASCQSNELQMPESIRVQWRNPPASLVPHERRNVPGGVTTTLSRPHSLLYCPAALTHRRCAVSRASSPRCSKTVRKEKLAMLRCSRTARSLPEHPFARAGV